MQVPSYSKWVVGGIIAAGGLWYAANTMYLAPRKKVLSDIAAVQGGIASLESQLAGKREVDARAERAVARTLAIQEDALSARLRDGLARLAEQNGLAGVVVDHGKPQDVSNPLLDVKGIDSAIKRELRNSADFASVRATLKGSGTLEQVSKAIAQAQVQPWIARVEGVTIRPIGKNRERFDLKMDIVTLLAPDFAKRIKGVPVEPDPVMVALGPDAERAAVALAQRNLFKAPPVPREEAVQPNVIVQGSSPGSETPRPQPFAAYEEWRLAGVAEGRDGSEAFFVNVKSGVKMTLQQGGQLLDAVFVGGQGEQILLDIGGKRFEVRMGDTLAARRPVG